MRVRSRRRRRVGRTDLCQVCETPETYHVLWLLSQPCAEYAQLCAERSHAWAAHAHDCAEHFHVHLCDRCMDESTPAETLPDIEWRAEGGYGGGLAQAMFDHDHANAKGLTE